MNFTLSLGIGSTSYKKYSMQRCVLSNYRSPSSPMLGLLARTKSEMGIDPNTNGTNRFRTYILKDPNRIEMCQNV